MLAAGCITVSASIQPLGSESGASAYGQFGSENSESQSAEPWVFEETSFAEFNTPVNDSTWPLINFLGETFSRRDINRVSFADGSFFGMPNLEAWQAVQNQPDNKAWRVRFADAPEILSIELSATRFAISDLVPEGVTAPFSAISDVLQREVATRLNVEFDRPSPLDVRDTILMGADIATLTQANRANDERERWVGVMMVANATHFVSMVGTIRRVRTEGDLDDDVPSISEVQAALIQVFKTFRFQTSSTPQPTNPE